MTNFKKGDLVRHTHFNHNDIGIIVGKADVFNFFVFWLKSKRTIVRGASGLRLANKRQLPA